MVEYILVIKDKNLKLILIQEVIYYLYLHIIAKVVQIIQINIFQMIQNISKIYIKTAVLNI